MYRHHNSHINYTYRIVGSSSTILLYGWEDTLCTIHTNNDKKGFIRRVCDKNFFFYLFEPKIFISQSWVLRLEDIKSKNMIRWHAKLVYIYIHTEPIGRRHFVDIAILFIILIFMWCYFRNKGTRKEILNRCPVLYVIFIGRMMLLYTHKKISWEWVWERERAKDIMFGYIIINQPFLDRCKI